MVRRRTSWTAKRMPFKSRMYELTMDKRWPNQHFQQNPLSFGTELDLPGISLPAKNILPEGNEPLRKA
jgi:hypothetical protein